MFKKTILCLMAGSILVMGLGSCSSMSNTAKGSLIGSGAGAALGAGVGALIGKNAKGTIIGAAVGTAVGATTGAIIGKQMDKKAAALKAAMAEQASVETVEDSQGLTAIKVTFDADMSFAKNSSTLSASAKTALQKFAQNMTTEDMVNTAIVVKGHTDSSGGDKINQPLSEKRAKAVGDILRSNNVNASRVTERGLASSEPKTDNAADAANRRVEVYVLATDAMVKQYQNQ
ncbi:MAG: OmpA family protein [Bacteroidales bacterium]|nr:OmpA family protein [Bacteroidales bacterium]